MMRAAALMAAMVLVTGTAAADPAPANGRSAPLGVSVRVTRPCEVNVATGTVGVVCGTERPAVVQVTVDDGQPSLRTLHGEAGGARRVSTTVPLRGRGRLARSVTIHF